ncbi:hypothetical protein GCM10007390_42960 [Persicitalea jodogahamensis]|uniref:Uncharacterized protein n=1 Tax=Persicitalea jodogahamensis TaxID=402147 RepID=A0A8J3D7A3_9BACT|nr:hypothetical protein GCM10007390_42960 [Persicitalea jodogahamensis]
MSRKVLSLGQAKSCRLLQGEELIFLSSLLTANRKATLASDVQNLKMPSYFKLFLNNVN